MLSLSLFWETTHFTCICGAVVFERTETTRPFRDFHLGCAHIGGGVASVLRTIRHRRS